MSIPQPVENWINAVAPPENVEFTFDSARSDNQVVHEMIAMQIAASPNKDLDVGQLIEAVKSVQRLKTALSNARVLGKPKQNKPQ